jgi:Xaa-Pro aminopeptidase
MDAQKLSTDFKQSLWNDGVAVAPYHAVSQILSAISGDKSIWIDTATLNYQLYSKLHQQIRRVEAPGAVLLHKACKNEVEMAYIRQTMVKDGVALVRFLMWLQREVPTGQQTEISAAGQLFQFRSQQAGFQSDSFSPIIGYRHHGAIVHYSATPQTNATLRPEGLLLVDSGGHYLGGTTDITRTITLGIPTSDEKLDFTLVLRGHIQLAQAVFPEGTKGYLLDTLARIPLWQAGLNYGHGTGHGVGYFLNVHEGPQRIGPTPTTGPETGFRAGMLTSNEPGIYRQGLHGIRTENLMLCLPAGKTEYGRFLKFETVSLCPIDLRLIETDLLAPTERHWLNQYHNRVFEQLAPHLTDEEVVWLHKNTLPV